MNVRTRRESHDACEPSVTDPGTPNRRPKRRWLRRAGIAALALLVVVAVSAAVNVVMEKREKATTTPYGERVPVTGGVLNVWRNGRSGPTIVLLSGLGTVAPGLDFAPLARELGDYNVIVVERFGYGYSDMTGPPQTAKNVTTELHEALEKVGAEKPYVLVGHSIAGFYTLEYVNRYPDEVSTVIGIDPTVPAGKQGTPEPGKAGINWGRLLAVTGAVRTVISIAPGLTEPPGGAYTADELERMRLMTIWNYGNAATADETARMGSNATALRGLTYPDSLPVLDILAKESVDTIPGWVQLHEDQLSNVRRHEVVVLDGPHYLHWTQSKVLAEKITGFIGPK